MIEEELEKMLEQLYKERIAHRHHTQPKSLTSDIWKGVGINMDFSSLYPSTMKVHLGGKRLRRKKKINRIFN
mgnify:CR=1 FL=1